jgi:chemotaxis signal transduction protein
MSISDAWLLEANDSLSIAIGDHEMVEFVHAATSFPVPGSPDYCRRVVFWQNNLVPVIDMGVLLGKPSLDASAFMSLVAYQQQPGSPLQYLAVKVTTAPEKILVDDAQVSEIPDELSNSLLMPVCHSCFTQGDRRVVILDIAGLCSAEFRDLVNPPHYVDNVQSNSITADSV